MQTNSSQRREYGDLDEQSSQGGYSRSGDAVVEPPRNNRGAPSFAPSEEREGQNKGKLLFFAVILFLLATIAVIAVATIDTGKQEQDPIRSPTKRPLVPIPIYFSNATFFGHVGLYPGEALVPGDFIPSPSGDFQTGLTEDGNLVLEDLRSNNTRVVWSAGIIGGYRCYMQSDGNLVVRDKSDTALWRTGTSKHDGASFVVDDGGRIGLLWKDTLVWMNGIPGGEYKGRFSSGADNLVFPVRGIFYYAWVSTKREVTILYDCLLPFF